MFKFFVAASSLLFALSASAQHDVTGVVRDSVHRQFLPGATVQLEGSDQVVVVDAFGKFRLRKVAGGQQTVKVSFVGFRTMTKTFNVPAEGELTFLLSPATILTDAVVVSATRATEKSGATYTTLSRDQIQKQNFGQDIPFLLNWTPSVITTSDAGTGIGYTGIRIRGSDATRINVTINGIPYNDSESQGVFWVNVPDIASSSESIQIQRGVGTSTNGAAAFGGTINMATTKRAENPYAEITNGVGSFNTRRHTFQFGTGSLGNWSFDGRLSKIVSDGFIDRASADLQSYYFSAGFHTEKTIVKAIMFGGNERTYQSWYGVPESRLTNNVEKMLETAANEGWNDIQTDNLLNSNARTFNPYLYENEVDDYQQDHYQLHFSRQLSSSLILNTALHYTKGQGYFEQYRYDDDFEDYGIDPVVIGGEAIESTDLIRRRWLDNDFYGMTYGLNYDQSKLHVVLGGGWNKYDGDHFGEIIWAQVSPVPAGFRYYDNIGVKTDFNTYLKTTYDFSSQLSAFVDLQYRTLDYSIVGRDNDLVDIDLQTDFTFFNPKFGLTYQGLNGSDWYASFSVTNREPVRSDFIDNIVGVTPRREQLRNVEAGWKKRSSTYLLQATYYLMNYQDQLVLTGALNDVGASLRTNVDRSYRTGLELEGMFKLSNRWQWSANMTLSRNKIREFTEVLYDYGADFESVDVIENKYRNTDISFSPNLIAGSTLSYFPMAGFEVSLLSKYVGEQFLDNTSNASRKLDAYLVNDIRLSYSWKPAFVREIQFGFLLNNLINEQYESNGYTWGYLAGPYVARENYYFPQAGTIVMAMITIKI